MSTTDRIASAVTEHSRAVVALSLVLTAVLGGGIAGIEQSSTTGFSGDSAAAAAQEAVRANFSARGTATTTTLVAVRDEGGNALSKASLLRTLRFQRALRENGTVNGTLVDDRPTVSVASIVARVAIAEERRRTGGSRDAGTPSLDEQIEQLSSMSDAELEAVFERLLDPGRDTAAGRTAYRLLPRSYEPGSTTADATLVVVTHGTDGPIRAPPEISERVTRGQLGVRAVAAAQPGPERYSVYGGGLIPPQQEQAISDSLAILGPLAVLFVLAALSLAYRDPVDVLLGLVGVGAVLAWTFGAMGWLGIPFGQTMIAAVILLVGLSVDYALHVVVRYREERADGDRDARPAMTRALSGVGPALVLVTATTAVGFLSNLTSPLGGIQEFGVVTAVGILATLLVFGLFVPALKVEVADLLGRWGLDRAPAPPGTSGRLRAVLGGGAALARHAPVAVLVLALLVGAGATYGATHLDISSDQEAFMADDPPAWTEHLPGALEPGEFYLKENRRYIFATFQSPETQGYVLVEGDVTADGTLERVAAAERAAAGRDAVFVGPGGDSAVETPLSAMRAVADRNRTFNGTFQAADADGDGIPDRNLETVYDAFYAAAPDLAARTVHRTEDGAYTALRLRIAVDGTSDRDAAVGTVTDAAAAFERAEHLEATATGQPVVSKAVDDRIATTLVESLGVTLFVVLALLAAVFRLGEEAASLGAVTLVPVALGVTWLLGTMAFVGIDVSVITALVGGIAVGLGVDYAIHVTERFAHERAAGADLATALERTATGTGAALAGSAATTAGGFGVLAFSLLPGLRQFGFVLAVGIVYAFLASVYVQPSVLALWDRHGPASVVPIDSTTRPADD